MTAVGGQDELEAQFAQWRDYVQRRRELRQPDVDELEDHLRGSVDELVGSGLRADEAFLVAVKRMGSLDELSHEFAREHSERLWKQLVLTDDSDSPAARTRSRRNRTAALGENVILLANLACSAWLLLGFLRRRTPFAALERWQTGYLPVYAAWAGIVVLAFPPLFHYV